MRAGDPVGTERSSEERPRAVVSWSSGKDSAYSLHRARRAAELEIVGLLTTITETFARVSMHGVRQELLARQTEAAGLPLYPVSIPFPCPNAIYEERMRQMIARLRADGVSRIVFGDLYLEEIRSYREDRLRGSGIRPVFPLWGRATRDLAHEMIASGMRATIVAVDPRKLSGGFAGRSFDEDLLRELPAGIDPCGENGEFHTFVTDGPMFRHPIAVRAGAVVERDGYVFADLEPV
ncbi:MAG: diphthine--ammonia ligase [Thermoplasmata archaeon]